MDPIVSVHNPHVKDVCALHRRKGRREQGRFLIEGWHLLAEALRWQMPVETVYYTHQADRLRRSALLRRADDRGAALIEVAEKVMRKICVTEGPQGVAAVVRRLEEPRLPASEKGAGVFLVLDRIQDPGNLGGILRVALAADVRGVWLMKGCADPYGSKALRGSMGSLFGLTVLTEVDAAVCGDLCSRMEGYVVALAAEGRDLYDGQGAHAQLRRVSAAAGEQEPLVLILGNEGQGVAPELLELAEDRWSVPMCHGVQSLNVAVAAGIVLYEVRRWLEE